MSLFRQFSWARFLRVNEKKAMHTHTWWQYVLLVAFLAVFFTGVTFAVGAVHFYKSTTKDRPSVPLPALLDDTTFFVLLSQTFPNILTSFFEVTKLVFTDSSRLKDRAVFLATLAFAVGLSFAAPIVYGTSDRSHPWVQVQTMILNASASLATILSGMISVFEARHSRAAEVAKTEAVDMQLTAAWSKIDEQDTEIKDLKEEIQTLRESASVAAAVPPQASSPPRSRWWQRNRGGV